MRVVAQDILEEWVAGGRNHFVNLDLIIITSKSHIEEIFIIMNAKLIFFSKSFTVMLLPVCETTDPRQLLKSILITFLTRHSQRLVGLSLLYPICPSNWS